MTVLRRATPGRRSAFSDGVFAVLITVLVLELRPPEAPTFHALLLLWPTWLSYAVSYLFIAIGPAGRDVLVVTQ
jgi:TMEM175 potassium channel family protein